MSLVRSFSAFASFILLFGFAGCWRLSGDAVVLGKDYVPAAALTPTPNESSASASPEPMSSPDEAAADADDEDETEGEEYTQKDEIGPPLDPRAMEREQWIVTVQMVSNSRRMDVRIERARWYSLKPGDRVHVTYREGKYTGTVWSVAID